MRQDLVSCSQTLSARESGYARLGRTRATLDTATTL